MDLSAIPAQPNIGLLHVVVEVPAGGRNKYEYLPAPGLMGLDRVLHPRCNTPLITASFPTPWRRRLTAGRHGGDGRADLRVA